jgi:hypothetical protein
MMCPLLPDYGTLIETEQSRVAIFIFFGRFYARAIAAYRKILNLFLSSLILPEHKNNRTPLEPPGESYCIADFSVVAHGPGMGQITGRILPMDRFIISSNRLQDKYKLKSIQRGRIMNASFARNFVAIVFACLVLVGAIEKTNAQEQDWKWHSGGGFANLDYPGNDYKSFDVENGSFPICMDACKKDEKCLAYTFVGSRKGSSSDGKCYLKKKIPEQSVYNIKCVSDYKVKSVALNALAGKQLSPTSQCPEFSFATNSPIPSAVIGGTYSYKIIVSGAMYPVEFCPMERPPDGTPPKCDRSPDQRFSMPFGLKLSKTGQISGQVKCPPGEDQSGCKEQYIPILIQAKDSCPGSPRFLQGEFWIHILKTPLPRGN